MSITLNGLSEWLYRLRFTRVAGKDRRATTANAGDDVTRLHDGYRDERRLLHDGAVARRFEAAHAQRDALRNQMHIL